MILSERMRKLGWLFFRLMWIPFIALMIGMMGMPNGEYSWSELPIIARYSLIGVGLFGAAATILLIGAPIASTLTNQSIATKGIPAEGKILKISDTGTTINNNPVVRLLLEVYPSGQPPFQAETERLIPRLQIPQIQPGAVVKLKYDPNTKGVALVDEDDPQPTQDPPPM